MYIKFDKSGGAVKKFLKYNLLIAVILLAIYSIAWFTLITMVTTAINEQYDNREINIGNIAIEGDYFIKFSKITSYGFPFQFAVKIDNWTEESKSNRIEYKNPVIIGYDLLKKGLFMAYSGEIQAFYKPLQSGFGSKILSNDYRLNVRLPLSAKLIKSIITHKDLFYVVNFIKTMEYNSGRLEVFDLVDNEKLYDADHEILKFSYIKKKHYVDLDDFLNNIPQQFNIFYSAKVNHTSLMRKISPENILHGFIWPFAINGKSNISITTGATTFADFDNDLEISMSYSSDTPSTHKLSQHGFFKQKRDNFNSDMLIKFESAAFLNSGFFDDVFEFLKYISINLPTTQISNPLKGWLEYVIDNKEQLKLKVLENKEYNFDIDFSFARRKDRLAIKINNLGIFASNSGLRLSSDSKIDLTRGYKWKTTGVMMLNNYQSVIDVILNNLYILRNKINPISETGLQLYLDTAKYFAKTISDHPNSTSNDLSFEYNIDSNDLANSKIGGTTLGKIKILYYLALYKKTVESIKSGDDLAQKMRDFAPELEQDQKKLLEHLMLKQPNINHDTWQQLIK